MKILIQSLSLATLSMLASIVNAQAQSIILEGNTNPGVSGSSPWIISGEMIVGHISDGKLTITDGGIVSSGHGTVGFSAGSKGTVIINGNGSKWENEAGLSIGLLGHGTIKISQGGNLSSLYSTVGLIAGSSGTVIVDGTGSEWNNSDGYMSIGSEGEGTLIISQGGSVLSNYSDLGANKDSTGTALIQDAGSSWKVTGALGIALFGQGTLNISNGAQALSDRGLVGFYDTGTGSVTVSGKGAEWNITDELLIGVFGTGAMEIANGGTVSSDTGILAAEADGTGTAVVHGNGSAWEIAGNLSIGKEGTGTLSLSDQGSVKASIIDLAYRAGSTGTINIGTGQHAGNLDASWIFGGAGQATVNFNHIDNLAFETQISGTLDLNHINKGVTTLTSANSYTGTTTINAGTLRAGAFGAFSYFSDYVIGAGGTLDLNGYTHAIGSLTNSGIIRISDTSGTMLFATGNYVGNGGLLALSTTLGDDNSQTDQLVIGGDSSGTSQLFIHNAGGLGAQTVEGIKVIEVHGASDGIFTLAGRYRNNGENTVVAGAYTYKLYQGSLTDPADGDWYLRSSTDDDGYQAGVPVYEVYPQFLLGLNALPTLQQRVGNRYWSHAGNQLIAQGADAVTPYAPAEEAGSFTQSNGVWGRMEGSYTKMQPSSSTSGAEYDYSAYKLQAGLDGLLHENEQGKLIGGVTVHYAHGLASVWSPNDSDLGRGRIRTDGYGFGGTLTWYSDNGFYIDNQAQVTWYRSDLSYQGGQEALTDGKNNGFGYALSSEIGKRFTLDDQWSLTPQAQLHYSGVDFDGFTDVFDAAVSKERAASLQARLGLSADYQNSWRNEQGGINRNTIYGIANLYNEFLNGTQVDVASVRFTNKSDRLWAGLGLGGTYNWNDDKYSLYGEGSVNTSLSHFGDSYAYKGTLGFRVKW